MKNVRKPNCQTINLNRKQAAQSTGTVAAEARTDRSTGLEKTLHDTARIIVCAEPRCKTGLSGSPNGPFRTTGQAVLQRNPASSGKRLCIRRLLTSAKLPARKQKYLHKNSMAQPRPPCTRPAGTRPSELTRHRNGSPAAATPAHQRPNSKSPTRPPKAQLQGRKSSLMPHSPCAKHENAPCRYDFPPGRGCFTVTLHQSIQKTNYLTIYIT